MRMLGKSPVFPLQLHFWYPCVGGGIPDPSRAAMCSNALMYNPLVSPYSTHILAGKTEESDALCRQETLFSATPLTQQALEAGTSVLTGGGFVMGRIPHFCKPPCGEILPRCVLESRNYYGNV